MLELHFWVPNELWAILKGSFFDVPSIVSIEAYHESWTNLRAALTFLAPDITLVMVSQPRLPKRTNYLHLAQFNLDQTLEKSELHTSGTI